MIPRPRHAAGRDLAPRTVLAAVTGRHPSHLRKILEPVACDVATHAALYDLDQAEAILTTKARRQRPRASTR